MTHGPAYALSSAAPGDGSGTWYAIATFMDITMLVQCLTRFRHRAGTSSQPRRGGPGRGGQGHIRARRRAAGPRAPRARTTPALPGSQGPQPARPGEARRVQRLAHHRYRARRLARSCAGPPRWQPAPAPPISPTITRKSVTTGNERIRPVQVQDMVKMNNRPMTSDGAGSGAHLLTCQVTWSPGDCFDHVNFWPLHRKCPLLPWMADHHHE
jgi:hypothetical protein